MPSLDSLNGRHFVLVHGMWHRPEHFAALATVIERAGGVVRIPLLHRGSLPKDVDSVQAEIDRCESAPVLLGHSYGGAVLGHTSGAAAMLFVSAFVLRIGESCARVGGTPPLSAALRTLPDLSTEVDPDLAAAYLYDDCSVSASRTAISHLVPQAPGHGRTEAFRESWRETESRYVICLGDRAMSSSVQQKMASRCASSVKLETSHSPYIAQPEVIAQELAGLASARTNSHTSAGGAVD